MPDPISGPAYRIVTPRTVLRCWNPPDAPLMAEAVLASVEHLKPWMNWVHEEPHDLQYRINLIRTIRSRFDSGQDFVYGIFTPDETRAIGGTGLHCRIGPNALEIGYWVHVDFVHQGIATEVSAALTKVAFEIQNCDRVEIRCDPENVYSAAVPKKLGFTHEATLRKRMPDHAGRLCDEMIWTLFREDYPTTPSASAQIQAFDAMGRQIQ